MNIVTLTLLTIVVVWGVFFGVVFLVGLLSGKQQDNTDEMSDDKDVSVLDVDMQGEGIKEQSIAEMNNIVEKESIFTRFLNLMRRRVILPKPSRCLQFIWSKLKRIFVLKTLIVILFLWPLLSFGRYLYLDYAINKGVNRPIDYTDVDAYNHPSQSAIESIMLNTQIIIHDKDYMMSFPIARSKLYVRVRWSGDIIIKDNYAVGEDACCGWLGKPCIGHYLYFNVWVYLILFLIMICRIRFHNINKLSKKTIITLCIIFALGILLLVRYLVLLQPESTSGSKTAIRCTLLGNVYRDYEYVLDCVDYYDRVSVWLYNIYFGAATLIYPIVVFVLNKCHKNKQK